MVSADTRDYTPPDPAATPITIPGTPAPTVLVPALTAYLSANYAVLAAGVIIGEIYADHAAGTACLFTWNGGAQYLFPIDGIDPSVLNAPFRFVTMVKAGDSFNLHFNGDSTPWRVLLQFVQGVPQWL